MTLTEFLLARIADDEEVAQQSLNGGDGVWSTGSHPMDECRVEGDGIIVYDEGGHTQAQASHIARHDPARVLAECEAKRRIVSNEPYGWEDGARSDEAVQLWRHVCQLLALPYADHPDYCDEWRP